MTVAHVSPGLIYACTSLICVCVLYAPHMSRRAARWFALAILVASAFNVFALPLLPLLRSQPKVETRAAPAPRIAIFFPTTTRKDHP